MYQNYWTEELAVWASKLACKDSYTAERIFSRWRKLEILSNPHKSNPHENEMLSHKIRKVGRSILDCKRENGNRTCPGLNTIPSGKWSRLWTDFDDDLPESSCTKPSSSSLGICVAEDSWKKMPCFQPIFARERALK